MKQGKSWNVISLYKKYISTKCPSLDIFETIKAEASICLPHYHTPRPFSILIKLLVQCKQNQIWKWRPADKRTLRKRGECYLNVLWVFSECALSVLSVCSECGLTECVLMSVRNCCDGDHIVVVLGRLLWLCGVGWVKISISGSARSTGPVVAHHQNHIQYIGLPFFTLQCQFMYMFRSTLAGKYLMQWYVALLRPIFHIHLLFLLHRKESKHIYDGHISDVLMNKEPQGLLWQICHQIWWWI